MKAYSLDPRQRALEAAASGDRIIAEVAGLFGVATAFINMMLRPRRAGEDLAPLPHGGAYTVRLSPRHEKLLRSRARQRGGA